MGAALALGNTSDSVPYTEVWNLLFILWKCTGQKDMLPYTGGTTYIFENYIEQYVTLYKKAENHICYLETFRKLIQCVCACGEIDH